MEQNFEMICNNIYKELPELSLIQNEELRELTVKAWAYSLSEYGFTAISQLQGSGAYDFLVMKEGTQVDHLRGVARLALAMAKEFMALNPAIEIDLDAIVAGGLLHDVGKPMEYNLDNQKQWEQNAKSTGLPPARHSVQGYFVCRHMGLPLEIAHIVGAHSKEGQFITRSVEAHLVHTADEVYWGIYTRCGLMKEGTY